LEEEQCPDSAVGNDAITGGIGHRNENTVWYIADVRSITAGNINYGQEPTFRKAVVPNLRIARGINLITSYRSHYRHEEVVWVDVQNAIGKSRRFAETAQSAVDENNELRWTGRAHCVWGKRARILRPGNAVPLQTDRLGKI
jgi:hypothetical protein